MSATKQLLLAVILLMSLLFACTTALNTLWAKEGLLQQMDAQTSEDARRVAEYLQAESAPGQPLLAQLPKGFESSRYQQIQITDYNGTISHARDNAANRSAGQTPAPQWFARWFPVDAQQQVAPIVRGTKEVGLVTLQMNPAPAIASLWGLIREMAVLFAAAAFVMAMLSNLILQRILRSVGSVVEQAEALTGGSLQPADEPSSSEVIPATRALNNLAASVEQQRSKQSHRVAAANAEPEPERDHISGLANREGLVRELKKELRRTDSAKQSTLCIVHLNQLRDLNQLYGRQAADAALADMGRSLNSLCKQYNNWYAARLSGADFTLLAVHADNPQEVAREAQTALSEVLTLRNMRGDIELPTAATTIKRGESVKDTLSRTDGALAAAVREGKSSIYVASQSDVAILPVREQLTRWREIFEHSFEDLNFSLATFPVAGLEGELLHMESPARLQWEGQSLTAGEFLPWINCLELNSELDKRVVELALAHIKEHDQPLCIHLSAAAISQPLFLTWLSEKLSADTATTKKLAIEFAEDIALRNIDGLRLLAARVRVLGCTVGLEHVGNQLSQLERLHDVELDYLKIDGRFVRAIDQNRGNQTLVRSLCAIGKERGILAIAEGVGNDEERNMLKALGINGVTGPGVKVRGDQAVA